VQSPPSHGGAGALLVLLQPVRVKRSAQTTTNGK
jgi:DNA-nicking Smr family endonuclease